MTSTAHTVGLLVLLGCSLLGRGQIAFPPSPALSGVVDVPADDVTVLPAGYDREINSPFSSTHLLSDGQLVQEASAVLDYQFQVFDPYFSNALGGNPALTVLASPPGTEPATGGIVYLPDTNQVSFTAFPLDTPPSTSNINLASLSNGAITQVPLDAPIGTVDNQNNGLGPLRGLILAATASNLFDTNSPAGVYAYDPTVGNTSVIVDTFFGLRYQGINDVICLTDGTIIYTDGTATQFTAQSKLPGQLPPRVYVLPYGGVPKVLIDGYDLVDPSIGYPHSLERSPDGSVLYVSVVPLDPTNQAQAVAANKIYAFDLVQVAGEYVAQNKRVFAVIDVGAPFGIRANTDGYIFVAAGDGVQVFSPGGKIVGKIVIPPNTAADPPVYNIVFAGTTLAILHNTDILTITFPPGGDISTANF